MRLRYVFHLGLVWVAGLSLLGIGDARAEFRAPESLGGTMFIGDSITHGSPDANISWRWWMHRLLVDNGIPYEEVGVVRGSHRRRMLHSSQHVDVAYGDTIFHNWHAAYSGAMSSDVSGTRASGKFRNTTLAQWLGRAPSACDELTPVDGKKISTFFVLLGTNDAITPAAPDHRCDWDAAKTDAIAAGIKENFGLILSEIKAANPEARVIFIEIPTWYQWYDAPYVPNHMTGVREINRQLREWAQAQGEESGVIMVSVDAGMADAASPIIGRGLKSMYAEKGPNGLHPNDQGALLIAGNVAKALGYAGATVGQPRRGDAAFEWAERALPLAFAPGEERVIRWQSRPAGGFSLSFSLSGGVGDGAAGGWDKKSAFCVSVGNGRDAGTLRIQEAYIMWNDQALYSLDASAGLPGALRVAYVQGEPERGVKSGFYVWLGDQLIGEALPSAGSADGVIISNRTEAEVGLSSLLMDSTGSYAPESGGIRGK